VAIAHADTVVLSDLPDSIRRGALVSFSEKKGEHRLIVEALFRFGGDKTRAAEFIGWTPDVLEKTSGWRGEERFRGEGEGWSEAA
jgi:regulatory Fis family protein